MALCLEVVNPTEIKDWDEKILSFKDYSFFHSQSWARVLIHAYNYKPCYFTLSENGNLRAVAPFFEVSSTIIGKKGVSLPFSDHCAPLVSEPETFTTLLDGIIEAGLARHWQRIEFKGYRQFHSGLPCVSTYNLHALILVNDEAALLKKFRGSTRRNILKATLKRLVVEMTTDFDALKEFYHLHCITRRHHGVPPQPFHFFRCIHEHLLSKGLGMIILARHEKEAVAGAVFFHFGRKAMYKYGASRRDCLEVRPNNLVMWEAIKWYAVNGFAHFDMGRSEPDNIGLNQFKNGWGTSIEVLSYHTFDLSQMNFCSNHKKSTTAAGKIFQKLPMPVLRAVGEMAYRHMG